MKSVNEDREARDIKICLTMMVRAFEKSEKTPSQQKLFDGAKQMLIKYFNPSDILRQAQQAVPVGALQWVREKPVFEKDCILLTRYKIRGQWDYASWLIQFTNNDYGAYWGWFTIEGEEYGDIADLTSEWYMVIPIEENPIPTKEEETKEQ